MAAFEFFLGTWTINGATGHSTIRRAFPSASILTIEETVKGAECRMFWTDLDGDRHDLRGIHFAVGRLVGNPARDELSGLDWNLTISESGKGITGAMRLVSLSGTPEGDGESNLAGVWGAEAPPPIRGEEPPSSSV